jgi:quinol monooxygenase YgiN
MVVVVGRVQTDADKREALIRVGQAVAAASRQEPGCIS